MLTPLGADQPHNARRAAVLGVATVLDAASAQPGEVARAVTAMLTDVGAHVAAAGLKAEIDSLPAVEEAVPVLEQLAAP